MDKYKYGDRTISVSSGPVSKDTHTHTHTVLYSK